MQVVEFKTRDGDVVTCCAERLRLVSSIRGMSGREPVHMYRAVIDGVAWKLDETVWRSLREQMKGGSA